MMKKDLRPLRVVTGIELRLTILDQARREIFDVITGWFLNENDINRIGQSLEQMGSPLFVLVDILSKKAGNH
jgi:hypothetical protein